MGRERGYTCVLPCYLCEQQNGINNCIERYIPVVPSKEHQYTEKGLAPSRRQGRYKCTGKADEGLWEWQENYADQNLISALNALKKKWCRR